MKHNNGRYAPNVIVHDNDLRRLYVDEQLSMSQISDRFGCSVPYLRKQLKRLGITIRPRSSFKCGGRKCKDLNGQTFGKWLVLRRHGSTASGNVKWLCRCQCGMERAITGTSLQRQTSVCCRSCSKRKGFGGICGKFWYDFQQGARRRGHAWEISIEYAWDLFQKQCGKCALSNIAITLPANHDEAKSHKLYTASIDRIDSEKGYIPGNVQWVHKHINLMKQGFSQQYFIDMCKRVVDHDNHKNSGAALDYWRWN